jgi:hypothetical protein
VFQVMTFICNAIRDLYSRNQVYVTVWEYGLFFRRAYGVADDRNTLKYIVYFIYLFWIIIFGDISSYHLDFIDVY